MNKEKLAEIIASTNEKRALTLLVNSLNEEKEKHIADISAIYDMLIQEKIDEKERKCKPDLKCTHDILFHYNQFFIGSSVILPSNKCVLCNCDVHSGATNYVIYDKTNYLLEEQADLIVDDMRALLLQLIDINDMDIIMEALRNLVGEHVRRK